MLLRMETHLERGKKEKKKKKEEEKNVYFPWKVLADISDHCAVLM